MKQGVFLLLFFFVIFHSVSQDLVDSNSIQNDSIKVIDNEYREDQFYFSLTYNLLSQKPENLSQQAFSAGFHFGFIRDMPINDKRNWAIGIGLGLSSNSYNQNMLILKEPDGSFDYSIIDEDNISFTKNKFTTYLVEIPLELRWRTSTPIEYKFWRIYSGVKFGYVLYNSSKFEGSLGQIKNSNIADMTSLQYGITCSVGYSTWNAHIYYGLNPLFDKSATINGQPIDLTSIKVGLIFYIL
jgi:hypothetical protein